MSDNQNNFNNQKSEDYFENSIEENISLDEKENENNITKNNVNEKEKEEKRTIKNNQNNSELDFKKKESLNVGKNSNVDNKNENEIKKELVNELIEKEKLLQQLITSNSELKTKIEYSNKKFEEIKTKIKNQEKDKLNIETQIKKIENDNKQYKTENVNYIKQIEQLKNKLELKEQIEKESNIKILLQSEKDKNKELKNKLNNLTNITSAQKKYINKFEKQNRIIGKINELKSEIENEKKSIKLYKERYIKLENFNSMISNEIQRIKLVIKKLEKKPAEEIKKTFSQNELNDTIGVISNLRYIINEKRNDLNNLCKINDDKIYQILSQNKNIESEINENIRMNKLLICKRNELKRIIKSILFCKK